MDDSSSSRLRVTVLIDGDVRRDGLQAIKHRHFIDTLASFVNVVDVGDMTLGGMARLLCAVLMWRPDLQQWKGHYRVNPLTFLLRSYKTRRWLLQHRCRPDVVLQFGALSMPWFGPPVIPYALYVDFTVALTRREWPQRVPMSAVEHDLWFRLESNSYKKAAVIFSRSEYVARSLRSDYGVSPEKIVVVGAGVNIPLPAYEKLSSCSTPHVLFVGSDFQRKGGAVLLAAWPEVLRHVPSARLTIFGQPIGSLPPQVTVRASTWTRESIMEAMAEAALFVMPSLCETWGDVFLEAMAFGLPCIGSTADAMPEIIVDSVTGYLVPAGDASALAVRIIQVLRDLTAARSMGRTGRRRVEAHFQSDIVVKRMMPVLQEIAPKAGEHCSLKEW